MAEISEDNMYYEYAYVIAAPKVSETDIKIPMAAESTSNITDFTS